MRCQHCGRELKDETAERALYSDLFKVIEELPLPRQSAS
jgi:hypothetical protein